MAERPRALGDAAIEDAEIGRAVALLGGQRALHRPVRSRLEAHDLLLDGLPGHALDHLVRSVEILHAAGHASLEKAIGMSLRTYQRRKDVPEKKLSPEQSGRTWKFAEILAWCPRIAGTSCSTPW